MSNTLLHSYTLLLSKLYVVKPRFRPFESGPYVYYLIKNKSCEQSGKLKVRTIYSYASHPCKTLCKLAGRALNQFLKHAIKSLPTWEIYNLTDVKQWILSQQSLIQEYQITNSLPLMGSLVELDVKEMFPSIPKDKLLAALAYIFEAWCATRRLRTRGSCFWSIHKQYKILDSLGKRDSKSFHVFSWNEIMHIVQWELYDNVFFRLGSSVYKQVNGIPIGGPMSAQLASLYCIACEHWKLKHSPPKLVFGSTIRFRDNILLIKLHDTSTT